MIKTETKNKKHPPPLVLEEFQRNWSPLHIDGWSIPVDEQTFFDLQVSPCRIISSDDLEAFHCDGGVAMFQVVTYVRIFLSFRLFAGQCWHTHVFTESSFSMTIGLTDVDSLAAGTRKFVYKGTDVRWDFVLEDKEVAQLRWGTINESYFYWR